MIQREFFRTKFIATVLTRVSIAAINILAAKFHATKASVIDEAFETKNGGDWEILAGGSCDGGVIL